MLRQCDDCGRLYDRRQGPGLRCGDCQPRFEQERHRLAELARRRRRGTQERALRRGDPHAARAFADGWLAGFADGEGCFAIGADMRPAFLLSLRDDDSAILQELRDAFGGSLTWRDRICAWSVSAKADLADLVAYFDEHPLRAKKRRDFAIWREAVAIYGRAGRNAPELPSLAAALRDERAYAGRLRVVA